jgi:predicted secreted Zn-dependent protease
MAHKLSLRAIMAKRKRDLAAANTPKRRKMRAENQRKRRAAIKNGVNITGKDYDHTKKRFVSVKANRGGHGKGTKRKNKTKWQE